MRAEGPGRTRAAWGGESRRKQQEAIEVGDPKKVLVGRELRGEWKQKEAAGGYRSRGPQESPGRRRAAGGVEAEGSSRRLQK